MSGTAVLLLLVAACTGPQKLVASSTATPSSSPSVEPSPSPIAPLAIASVAFHAGEVGFAYSPVTPTAKGGVPPYTWTVSGGSFPGGLVMSPAGVVSGTPTATGTFLFTVQVGDTVGGSATISTSIAVSKHIAVTATCPTGQPCLVEVGCVTACGVFGNQSGGVSPFTYKVVAGAIPTGMGLNGFSLTKAFPSPAKDWIFTVIVTDAVGATARVSAKFHVFAHVAFTPPATATCSGNIQASGCRTTLAYTLGTPGLSVPTVTYSGPKPPSGYTFTAQSGTVTVSVPPQPVPSGGVCSIPPYVSVLKLTLVDKSICAANTLCASTPATVTFNLPNTC